MPDVGVLELKISANIRSATDSLRTLKARISDINKATQGFNLQNVSTQIEGIVNSVKGNKEISTAVKNLASLLNAIAAFSKIKGFGLDEAQLNSLKNLQDIANGFKMGAAGVQLNQMRQAISEPWNAANAQSAAEAMDAISSGAERLASAGAEAKISKITKTLKEYASAINEIKSSLGDGVSIPTEVASGQGSGFVSLGLASSQGMQEGIKQGTEEVASAARELGADAIQATKDELEVHSPSHVYHNIGLQTAAGFNNGLTEGLANLDVASPLEALKSRFLTASVGIGKEVSASLSSLRAYKEAALSVGHRMDPESFGIPVATSNIEAASNSLEGFAETSQVIKEVQTVVQDIGQAEAEVVAQMNSANRATEEDIRLRKEELALANQRRLESNYASYRELYLSKEGEWEKQVPEMYGFTPKALEEGETYAEAMKITMQEVNEYVDQFIEKMNTPTGALLRDTIEESLGVGRAVKSAEESAKILQTAPEIKEKTQEVQTAVNSMSNSMSKGKTETRLLGDTMKELDNELKDKKTDINNVSNETRSLKDRFEELMFGTEGLKGSISRMFPTLSGLFNRFKQLVKYRALRAIIKQISEGFQEGTENYYYYSQAIGGTFATSMDNAASSLLTMKNSIGAAVAPLISSLIPYLQTVVNLFVEAVNYVNQFFALLNGQGTWSRATAATTTAFDDIADSASGASDSVSDLLADWDELNIIQSESSNGGSGTSGTNMSDYLDMFEEVSEYDETIKEIVNFIQDHFDDILSVATAIGTAILGWKVSNAFSGLVGKLGLLAGEIASIYIGVKLTDLFGQQYAETGEPGWLIADALSGAVGAYFAGRIANKLFTGNSAGFIVGGFTLVLEGAVNIKNAVNAMSQQHEGEAWMLDALGSLEVGIGAGLIAFGLSATGPVSLALGTAVTVAMFLFTIPIMMKVKREAEYRQMAIEAFSKTGKDGISTEEYIKALQTRVNELTEGSEVVVSIALPIVEHQENFLSTLLSIKSLNALLSSDYALSEEDAQAFKDAWDIVISEFAEIEKINFETIYAGLDDVISNGSEKIREEAIALRKEAVEIARVMGGARGAMEEEMNQLTSDIVGGTLSGTDLDQAIARYEELYKIIAETEESGIGELQQRLQEGAAFDFSSGENPIEEAVNFIKTVSEQEIAPALESAKEAYETEIQAIEDAYSELEVLKKAGYLTDEQYTQSKEGLDRIKKLYEDAYADRVEQINALTQDAYKTVLEQAVAGLSDIDTSDKEAVNAYVKNVMDPITKALEEAGYEIPSDVKALMEMVTNEVYSFEPPKDSAVDKKAIYEGFARLAETNQINEMTYPIRMSIAYEIDENGGQAVSINDEKASDIVNGLIQTFDYQMDDVFEQLNATFGWSYEDIFSKINLGALDVEQLENLIETVATLKTLAQEKLTPSSLTYNEDYKGIEDEYTNYMNEIQSIIEGQKEKTIEAPELEIQQPTRTEIVGEESEYDAVLEWDSEGFKEEIREDVSGMDPIDVPLNADFGAESSTSPTATSGNWASASLEGIWNSAMANAASAFNQAFGENSMFGTITINTERNDEQDTNNIAEGTKRGNVGLEAKLGQLNSTMSQLNGNVVNIAAKIGGGLTNIGASATGSLINSALNAFNMVKG